MKNFLKSILIIWIILLTGCSSKVESTDYADKTVEIKTIEVKNEIDSDSDNLEALKPVPDSGQKLVVKVEKKSIANQVQSSVDLTLSGIDQKGNTVWTREWTDIMLTELDPFSEEAIWSNRVFIEVAGKLYGLDLQSGQDLFTPIMVGAIEVPVVDLHGNLYCSGYYDPFLTKIATTGEIIWQIESLSTGMWPETPVLMGKHVLVRFEPIESAVNSLLINADTGESVSSYWLDEGQILFEKANASSTLEGYPLSNLKDADDASAWVEGVTGDGVGEWLLFESDTPKQIMSISLLNGYHKSEALYRANNRVETMTVELSDGYRQTIHLEDQMKPLEITLDQSHETRSVKLIIETVYKGSKYQDTVISGIGFY